MANLDAHYAPCGPCAVCGFHDKRHRVWDDIMSRVDGGESAGDVASDLGLTLEHVAAVLEARPYEEASDDE